MHYFIFLLSIFVSFDIRSQTSQPDENAKNIFKSSLSYLVSGQKLQEAKRLTYKSLKKFPNDQEVIRLDGLISFLLNDYQNSSQSFKRAAQLSVENSDKAINLYLLAKTFIKMKRMGEAKKILGDMESLSVSSEYSKKALRELESNGDISEFVPSQQGGEAGNSKQTNKSSAGQSDKKNLGLVLTGVLGLDTNPVFVPDFSQTKNEAKSTFYTLNASISKKSQIHLGDIGNSLNIGYTNYSEEIAKSFNNLRLGLLTTFDPDGTFFKRYKINFTNKLDQSYQADGELDYYFTSDVLSLKKEIFQSGINTFSGLINTGFRTYANKNLIALEDDRSGFSYGLRGVHKMSKDDWAWLNSLSLTKQQTYGGKFDTINTDYSTNIQKLIFYDFEALLGFGLQKIDYINSNSNRVDYMMNYGADISRGLIIDGLNIHFNYSRTKNNSDIDEFTYTQDIFSLWINYEM
jgi:hypothetical protein